MMQLLVGLLILVVVAAGAWGAIAVWLTFRWLRRPPRHALARTLASGAPLTAEEAGLPSPQHWTVPMSDGQTLPVWAWSGDQGGPVTILVHDWMGGRIDFLGSVAMFLADSTQVVAADRRGHGDGPIGTGRDRQDLEDAQVVREHCAEGDVRLVGHGLGASLVLAMAADSTRPVTEVIAVDPWSADPEAVADRLVASGLVFRPPRPILNLAMRLAGTRIPVLRPIPRSVDVQVEVSDPDWARTLRSRLQRGDDSVSVNCPDASSP